MQIPGEVHPHDNVEAFAWRHFGKILMAGLLAIISAAGAVIWSSSINDAVTESKLEDLIMRVEKIQARFESATAGQFTTFQAQQMELRIQRELDLINKRMDRLEVNGGN